MLAPHSGVVLSGSDFTYNYQLFTRTNDTPLRFREGMVRFENAADISLTDSALLDAGFSALWLQGFAQNITATGNRIERSGFCGVYLQGIYPGDTTSDSIGVIEGGPIDSAEKSDVNKGHLFADNSIHDYGRRVGHGSGFWFFQAGRTRVTHNQVIEGPRDAFGLYGVRQGSFPKTGQAYGPLYGKMIDFWGGTALCQYHLGTISHAVLTRFSRISQLSRSSQLCTTRDAPCGVWRGACRMMTAACNPMVCRIPAFRSRGLAHTIHRDR